jgi:hypothetical protein
MTMNEYLKRPDAKGYLKVLDTLKKWDAIGVFGTNPIGPEDEYLELCFSNCSAARFSC